MELVLSKYTLPEDKQIKLFTHLRLAYAFPSFEQRLLCIQARLQALSILGRNDAELSQPVTARVLFSGSVLRGDSRSEQCAI